MTKPRSVRMPDDLYWDIAKFAATEHRTPTNAIVHLLRIALEKVGEDKPPEQERAS